MGTTGHMAVGHPVDVASGVLFNHFLDFALPGPLPLSFGRFYSTGLIGRQRSEPLGSGWRHAFQHELRQTVDGFAYVDATGVEVALADLEGRFEREGRLLSPPAQMELSGSHDQVSLRLYGSGHPTWRLCFSRLLASLDYRLTALELNPKVRLELGYDAQGRLVRILQTRMKRSLRLEYGANGRLETVWYEGASRDLVARYGYDERGQLSRVTDRVGEVARFEYDDSGRMVSEARCSGAVYVFRYEATGRCVYASGANRYEERTLAYDVARRQTRVTDSHGYTTLYEYNESGQISRIQTPLGGQAHYTYDAQGKLTAIQGVLKQRAAMEYDEFGRLRTLLPLGSSTPCTIEYDARHLPIQVTVGNERWIHEYDAGMNRTRLTDPAGQVWSYAYNEYDELVSTRGPLGHEERRQWGPRGELVAFTSRDGHVWRAEYDDYGRRVAEIDPAGTVTRQGYDRAGNLSWKEAPDGRRWRYEYDGGGRCTRVRGPGDSTMRARYNACGQVLELIMSDGTTRRFEWDTEPGRLLALEDGRGRRREWTYDAQGRVSSRRHLNGSRTYFEFDLASNLKALVTPTGERFEFEHDSEQRLVARRAPDGTLTRYEYDGHSRLMRLESPGSEIVYERDVLGQLTAEVQNGVRVQSTYDAEGRRLELSSTLGASARFEWSPEGHCQSIHSEEGTLRFRYGPLGEELERLFPGGGRFTQEYDQLGRLAQQSYLAPGQSPVSGGRSSSGLEGRSSVHRRFGYDALGYISSIEDSVRGWVRFTHDQGGRLQSVHRSNGEWELFDWDASGNRHTSARLQGTESLALETLFRRDEHRLPRLDLHGLSRLGAEVSVAVTPEGNRITELQRSGEHLRYEYDEQGRLLRKHLTHAGDTWTWHYEWNGLGQLVALTRPNGERWIYEYDALGRRVAKHGPKGTRRYVWDDFKLLHELEPSGEVITCLYGPQQLPPLLERRAGVTHYVLPDRLGSMSERVTQEGHLVWASQRGTWGELPSSAPEGEPGFPGQSYDTESGLYYNQARYYDPQLGRYISPDPIGLLGGLNEYTYAPSPVIWMDPMGLSYITGGPYNWAPQGDGLLSDGIDLDLHHKDNRVVWAQKEGHTNGRLYQVATASKSTNGKCLAVVEIQDSAKPPGFEDNMPAFISGHGEPVKNTTGESDVVMTTQGKQGNWTHAENQALHWLDKNNVTAATIFVDRLPCAHCRSTLPSTLDKLGPKGKDRQYTVLFFDNEAGKYLTFEAAIEKANGMKNKTCG